MDWIKWIKLIITAIVFSIPINVLILINPNILIIAGIVFIAGLIWSHFNKLNISTGLLEGFILGAIVAVINEIFYNIYAGWVNFSSIWLIESIILLGIPSAIGASLYGIRNR